MNSRNKSKTIRVQSSLSSINSDSVLSNQDVFIRSLSQQLRDQYRSVPSNHQGVNIHNIVEKVTKLLDESDECPGEDAVTKRVPAMLPNHKNSLQNAIRNL